MKIKELTLFYLKMFPKRPKGLVRFFPITLFSKQEIKSLNSIDEKQYTFLGK